MGEPYPSTVLFIMGEPYPSTVLFGNVIMKKSIELIIALALLLTCAGAVFADGARITPDLWIKAVIQTREKGAIEAVWKKGGEDSTQAGDHVIWGYFYASPDDVNWGSEDNPDLFVKIWFDRSGRLDVNFFHVSVPDIEVYSDYPYDGIPDAKDTASLSRRYVRQYFTRQDVNGKRDKRDNSSSLRLESAEEEPLVEAGIFTDEKGLIDAVWYKCGEAMTPAGHKVIWGYFYASPDDVNWGSQNNPDVFVKIWFDISGRTDVNFFHVSVPMIAVYSDAPDDTAFEKRDFLSLESRYVRHEYYAGTGCSVEEQNEFVYDLMRDVYLWYDKVPTIDYSDYTSPEDLLQDLVYKEDKWSSITSREDFHNFYDEGEYIGLGCFLKIDDQSDCRVKFVHQNSPADVSGMERGDKILEINGKPVSDISLNDEWESVIGENEIGVNVNLKIADSEGVVRDIAVEKEWVTVNTVLYHDILENRGVKIGYVVFYTFIEAAREELDAVFAQFRHEKISELIVDLRYNGGGEVSVARYLASLIGGDRLAGEVFIKTIHNRKYSIMNETEYFVGSENAVNPDRVIFITGERTCSASELVINSLKPYMEVVLIGSKTCGKPYGMYGWDFCDKHITPVSLKAVNAYGEADYLDGMSPDCGSRDDLSRAFGDIREDSLKQAMYYIVRGTCLDESELSETATRKSDRGDIRF